MPSNKAKVNNRTRPSSIAAAGLTALLIVMGVAFIPFGHAGTSSVAFEAESGKLAGPGSVIADTSASGGKALRFNGTAITTPCSNPVTAPVKYDHIIWVYEENTNYTEVINNPSAPYITKLANACGTTSQYLDNLPQSELDPTITDRVVYHSWQEDVAAVAGSNCTYGNGIHGTDCWNVLGYYGHRHLTWRSLFSQVTDAGGTWRQYSEAEDTPCQLTDNSQGYKYDHNAVADFVALASSCATQDVSFPAISCPDKTGHCTVPTGRLADDIKNDRLASFNLIVPTANNEMHDGTTNQGDTWLATYLPLVFNSATYKEGKTAIFIIWDETDSLTKTIPFVAISPSTNTGIISAPVNNFAVLRATEDMLGITEHLGCATGTPPHAPGLPPPAGSSCFPGVTADVRSLFRM